MACSTYMLEPCPGETFRLQVIYKDTNGVVVNLTGWDVTWTIEADGDATVIVAPDARLTVTPLAGQIDLMLTTDDVEDLAGLTTSYSLLGTNTALPAGEGDYTILEGRIDVR